MTRRVRTALLAGAGLLLLQLGWILSIAPHFGIDEFDHALRSSSVAQGYWEPGDNLAPPALARGDLIPVRTDVAESVRTSCELRPYTRLYNCRPEQALGNDEVLIASSAARYNPTFYAVVGTAAAPFHGTANLYAMRVVVAVLGAVLFGLVVWLAAARARTRWPVAVVVLAALPTTVYSASVATPNGLEMLAGLGVWVALLAVTDPADSGRRRSAYLLLALFVAAVVNLHTLGAVWLALTVVAVAVVHGPVRTARALWPRGLAERLAAGAAAFAVAFEVVWVLVSGNTDTSIERREYGDAPWPSVLSGLLRWPLQAIGAYPMRDNAAPVVVYPIVLVVLGTVAVLALRRTRWRSRPALALAFVAVMSYAVPATLTVLTYREIGPAWQGRYVMPFAVGLLVLAGRQLDSAARPVARGQAIALVAVLGLVATQLISQVAVAALQEDIDALVEGTGWMPPSTVLLATLAALALVCWARALSAGPAERGTPTPLSSTSGTILQEAPA